MFLSRLRRLHTPLPSDNPQEEYIKCASAQSWSRTHTIRMDLTIQTSVRDNSDKRQPKTASIRGCPDESGIGCSPSPRGFFVFNCPLTTFRGLWYTSSCPKGRPNTVTFCGSPDKNRDRVSRHYRRAFFMPTVW